MGKVQCWIAQGLSSEIHPSKVGMIKKQQQDDDNFSTSSVNAHLYHRVINLKDESCFQVQPAAGGSESLDYASIQLYHQCKKVRE